VPCLVAVALHAGLVPGLRADGNSVPGGIAGIAAAEAQKRQGQVEAAQTLFTAGSKAYADQSYAEAMDYFKAAFETVPDVPAVEEQRKIFFKRFQSASYRYAEILAAEAKWPECEKTLADVVALAESRKVPAAEIDPALRKMLKDLQARDERYNLALTPQHLRDVNRVEAKLILARGFLELGDYDRAERSYHEVLNVDPFSTAARRGLEEVERFRMNYYDAAYDHTRSKKLAEVAAGWESPVSPVLGGEAVTLNADGVVMGGNVELDRKLKEIIIPTLEFSEARLAEVIEFLGMKAQELDTSETDPTKRGVNFVIDSGTPGGEDPGQRTLTVRLANVPLGVALRYAAQQAGMTYRTDNFAVRIIPPSAGGDGALSVQRWVVPPGFLSGAGEGDAGGAAAPADPFANPEPAGGAALVKRVSAQDFLNSRGVQFGAGASANYVAATSSLVVKNTAEQLQLVNDIVQSAKDSGAKNVEIHVRMVSVEAQQLQQLGLDFLLGASNIDGSARAFFAGGTDGNAGVPVNGADFPFVGPTGPVGTFPVSSGLRMGQLNSGQSIDDVINRDSPDPVGVKAPGIFSVAGVFTDPQFQMVLRALSQAKGSDFLSDAHVVTRPGQLAKIEQVREFIYPTEYDPPEIPNEFGTGIPLGNVILLTPVDPIFPATPATPTAFETRRLGKSIEVEPTVASDNKTISLNVLMDFSDFAGFINYGTPITNSAYLINGQPSVVTPNEILMPVFDAIKETTSITIWDGQTVAIGGFHGESVTMVEDKIPYLGDLPVLGRAFRSEGSQSTKRALTIFVTVRLVDPGGNPINAPVEEETPELMTRRDLLTTPPVFAPGPPPVYPAK
jgi:general secretion pathway protein D